MSTFHSGLEPYLSLPLHQASSGLRSGSAEISHHPLVEGSEGIEGCSAGNH